MPIPSEETDLERYGFILRHARDDKLHFDVCMAEEPMNRMVTECALRRMQYSQSTLEALWELHREAY